MKNSTFEKFEKLSTRPCNKYLKISNFDLNFGIFFNRVKKSLKILPSQMHVKCGYKINKKTREN